jgi:hypothetical protein
MAKGMSNQRTGQLGVNAVERVVLHEWKSRWQTIDAQNDDGIDGLIFLERDNQPTGQIIYAQVKCRNAKVTSDHVKIGEADGIVDQSALWRRVAGAAIIIYVNASTWEMTWGNLRDEALKQGTRLHLPRANCFNKAARREIEALCGHLPWDMMLPRVATEASDFRYIEEDQSLARGAQSKYKEMRALGLRLGHVNGPLVRFTQEGWRHITRRGRRRLRRHQAFLLLGVVPKMLAKATIEDLRRLTKRKGEETYALRAMVAFPFRQSSMIKLVLKRKADTPPDAYDFHTVYEYRRKRDLLGIRLGAATSTQPIITKT